LALPPRSQLKRDLAAYYGYNAFLADQVLGLFPPAEAVEFMEACEVPRPVSLLRVHLLTTGTQLCGPTKGVQARQACRSRLALSMRAYLTHMHRACNRLRCASTRSRRAAASWLLR
jgi:hypothetical protein